MNWKFWAKDPLQAPSAGSTPQEGLTARQESGQGSPVTSPRGWHNPMTGQGTAASDNAVHSKYAGYPPVSEEEAGALFDSSSLAARIAEVVPRDASAPGSVLDLPGEMDAEEVAKLVNQALAQVPFTCQGDASHGAQIARLRTEVLARVYGGALLVGIFDDLGESSGAQPMETPLREGAHLLSVRVYQRHEVPRTVYNDNAASAMYGHPEVYSVVPRSPGSHQEQPYSVHASRCIRLGGVVTSSKSSSKNQGWGDSIYRRMREALEAYASGRKSIGSLLNDAALYAIGMDGLSAKRSRDSTGAINARLHEQALMKGRYGGVVYDKGKEEVGFRSPALSGVADLADRQSYDVSNASTVPVVRLFGMSPGGLSTDDAQGTRNYHDALQIYRDDHQHAALTRMTLWGLWLVDITPPPGWSVQQGALGAPSAQEALEAEKTRSEIYKTLIEAQVPATVAAGILEGSKALSAADLRTLLEEVTEEPKDSRNQASA